MSMRVITVTIGMRLAMTKPVLRPMKNNMTAKTTAMAWIRLPMKSSIFSWM